MFTAVLVGDEDEIEKQLAELAVDQVMEEAAEDGLESAMVAQPHPDPVEQEVVQPSAQVQGDSEEEEEEEESKFTWELASGDAFFISKGPAEAKPSAEAAKDVAAPIGTFKDMPSFQFLEQLGMTEIPNVEECGIGVHFTNNVWQVRYPCKSGKKSAARSWGVLKKKGFVSPCKALLECLHWAWQSHLEFNPDCAYTKGKVQVLKGAIMADLGRDVK